jgi:hypothetical protein
MRFCVSKCYTLLMAVVVASSITGAAQATIVFNTSLADPPGLYYGTDNQSNNHGFVVNTSNGVELGLGVNLRKGAEVAPTSTNVYNVSTGVYTTPADFCTGTCANWNFQFSVNLGTTGLKLSDVTTDLTIVNVGTGQSLSFNPFTALPDNSAYDGTNTRNGNTLGQQAVGTDVGFQNGENLRFFVPPFSPANPNFSFDPLADDTYLITLSLTGPNDLNLSVDETIIAGVGAAATPLPAALPLFASGLGVMGFVARRRKRKATV